VTADHLGVGHQDVGQHAGEALGEGVDEAAERTPLGAAFLDAVHVQRDRRAAGLEKRQEQGVGRVHDRAAS
jgi:hypothetical protein